ncbi:MAG: ankyrin repeat domain-containing protein [Gammaproteobacteria bacterium]|nr:ankyrin repeat domain-containing protein [Gammaproteobacteria bacterium]
MLANPALDVRDDHNRSLLQNALFANNNDIVALLLAQGQNANDKTLGFKKRPSLHIPIEKSNREVVQMLLDAGVDPSATDSTGKTGSA